MSQHFNWLVTGVTVLLLSSCQNFPAEPLMEQTELYISGAEGYHTFRIPALVVSTRGTLLAFCEGRKETREDAGNIHLVLKRSTDGGTTWGPLQIVWKEEGGGKKTACGNPCPVVDEQTGTIHLAFCRNNDRQFITTSDDDGVTWSQPTEITDIVDREDWGFYGTGPGHGIQLKLGPAAGRLLIPSYHHEHGAKPGPRSHMIYSDDHGKTWQLGESVPLADNARPDPEGEYYAGGECALAELGPGEVYLNTRCGNYASKCDRRTFTRSHDGGLTWKPLQVDPALIAPGCHGGVVGYPQRGVVLHANPASGPDPNWDKGRKQMMVRASLDGCRTWPASQMLHTGASSYADLAVLEDGTIVCLYEGGRKHRREWVRLARFKLEWLLDGQTPILSEVR